jgi:sugar-specific transcriptional regulator TrmB
MKGFTMILIDKTFETVTYESAEDGEAEDSGFSAINEQVSFRELVEMMRREYIHSSSSPVQKSIRDWFTNEAEQDYRTGEYRSESIHFSSDNHQRKAKYWIKAMACAGYIK